MVAHLSGIINFLFHLVKEPLTEHNLHLGAVSAHTFSRPQTDAVQFDALPIRCNFVIQLEFDTVRWMQLEFDTVRWSLRYDRH